MFCPTCGTQFAPSVSCTSCGAAVPAGAQASNRLVRPRHPRMIAGVCSGLAIRYGWDVAMVRIVLTVIACLTLGWSVLFYLAAWVLVPEAQYALPATSTIVGGTTSGAAA
jgi:phage shock protein C